jgi:hypothetical protein
VSELKEAPLPDVAAAIIRLLVFESLQIPHTCVCHSVISRSLENDLRSSEEMEELHDDWREQIARHEKLVCEFQAMYETSTLPLFEFLKTSWLEEIQDLLDHEDPLSPEEVGRIRELGVVIDEVDEDQSQDEVNEEEWWPDAESSPTTSE